MGNGLLTEAKTIRYMGGKLLPKYFQEDLWPTHKLFFTAFNLDSNNAFLLFAIFSKLDTEQQNRIPSRECFKAFGVIRSKFTERIFSREFLSGIDVEELRGGLEDESTDEKYSFKEFLIIVWHYCSLSYSGIARYIFEIFDPDNIGKLEKADVEAMYRLLFDTSEHDEQCINAIYPFDEDDKIFKDDFIQYSSAKTKKLNAGGKSSKLFSLSGPSYNNTDMIWPAIQVQEVLRKTLGGSAAWKSVTNFRERTYSSLESRCDTLPEAIGVILRQEQEKMANMQRSADLLLEESRRRLQEEAEAVQKELRERELQEEREMRKLRATDRDTPMNDALSEFEEKKTAFISTEFTLDDIWERHEARLALFESLDRYVELAKEYREWKHERDTEITEGTAEDLEYRYQDYIKTSEGNKLHRLMVLVHVYQRLQETIDTRNAKKGKSTKSGDSKSDHEMFVEKYLRDLHQLLDSVAPPPLLLTPPPSSEAKEGGEVEEEVVDVEPQDLKKRLQRMQERSIEKEQQYAKSKAIKGDWVYAESESHTKLSALLKRRTMRQFYKDLEVSKEEERREYIRRDFDLCTSFGSRITKWEYVLDEENDRMVYVSVDTLEQRHAKTAICERCDDIIVQHEMRCTACGALRSAKNQKLFRPLGFKDITLE